MFQILIPLALENSTIGKHLASQALAKLSISINPEVAFPGQRVLEVVRPLLKLLHPERTALQNFEALMALTNITSVSESARLVYYYSKVGRDPSNKVTVDKTMRVTFFHRLLMLDFCFWMYFWVFVFCCALA